MRKLISGFFCKVLILALSAIAVPGSVFGGEQALSSVNPKQDEQSFESPGLTTGYLQATPGYEGNVIGATVTSVDIGNEDKLHTIEINLPISPDRVDRVMVISPTGMSVRQAKEAEILRDYEHNNVGIKLFLPRTNNFAFKLKLIDLPEGN